ncbi:MAG TPA: hypothetical protein PKE40_14780 [Arachnia sp.]|nr:hypothetical protein [Arachnia sp.]HMT87609.1 hypothetical protein [Arachnia sp.]
MSEAAEFARQLAHAVTGEWLPVTRPGIGELIDDLAGCGWDALALRALRKRRQDAGEPWPFPVEVEAVRGLGFARFHSRLAELSAAVGLDGIRREASADRPWTAEERRLASDRPPHWG